MRLAFFCSSLEPGRDGVGDYSRRLAAECTGRGHTCALIALNDPHVSRIESDSQEMDGVSLKSLRLPGTMPWNQRTVAVRQWLAPFDPEWISLQLVPFGFHPKGLCFGLGKQLAAMNTKARWQVMLHELWLGLGEGSSPKHRVWGALQRRLVLDLLNCLRPRIINTQADPYRIALGRETITAAILPLFGNIPYLEGDGWHDLLEPLISQAAGTPQKRSELYLAGILGGVHPEWDAERAVAAVLPLAEHFQKKLALVFHGKNNLSPAAFDEMKLKLKGRAQVVVTGEKSPRDISRILQTLDLGLATSPRQIIQKSGSAAAMLEHGLKLLVTRDDWRLRGTDFIPDANSGQFLSPRQFAVLDKLPTREAYRPEMCGVVNVATTMLAAMETTVPLASASKP